MRIDSLFTHDFGDWEVYLNGELVKENVIIADTDVGMVEVVYPLEEVKVVTQGNKWTFSTQIEPDEKIYTGRVELVNKKTGVVIRSQF